MSVTGQQGTLAIGPQTAKGSIATTWYRYKATGIQGGAMFGQNQFPPEAGGGITPTGAYRTMAFYALTGTMIPRLENSLGWLLYGALGSASSVASWGGEAGVYGHLFTFATDEASIPWMSAYKNIPGSVETLQEKGLDCKINMLDLTVAAANLVGAQVTLQGRVPSLAEDVDLSGHEAFDGYASAPVGNRGHWKIGGAEYPATGVRATLGNGLTNPQQEMIVGELYPDDFTPLIRAMNLRWTYKWANPDLYQQIFAGAADGTAWSTEVFESTAELLIQSPANISGKNQPYALKISCAKVTWQPDGPVQIAPGQLLMQPYVGTVQENSGGNYCEVLLVNEQENYTWPS